MIDALLTVKDIKNFILKSIGKYPIDEKFIMRYFGLNLYTLQLYYKRGLPYKEINKKKQFDFVEVENWLKEHHAISWKI